MTSPLPLPDWVPWWGHLAIILAMLLFGLLFLLMPFSVFGVKTRLEAIDARLDEIQGEIRSLSLRLPEAPIDVPDDYDEGPVRRPNPNPRPPIPPAPLGVVRPTRTGSGRTEPRLY